MCAGSEDDGSDADTEEEAGGSEEEGDDGSSPAVTDSEDGLPAEGGSGSGNEGRDGSGSEDEGSEGAARLQQHAAAAAAAGEDADPASDSSEDERPNRNTIGGVPLEWYQHEEHIGYDVDGRRLEKQPGRRKDRMDALISRADSMRVGGRTALPGAASRQRCEAARCIAGRWRLRCCHMVPPPACCMRCAFSRLILTPWHSPLDVLGLGRRQSGLHTGGCRLLRAIVPRPSCGTQPAAALRAPDRPVAPPCRTSCAPCTTSTTTRRSCSARRRCA